MGRECLPSQHLSFGPHIAVLIILNVCSCPNHVLSWISHSDSQLPLDTSLLELRGIWMGCFGPTHCSHHPWLLTVWTISGKGSFIPPFYRLCQQTLLLFFFHTLFLTLQPIESPFKISPLPWCDHVWLCPVTQPVWVTVITLRLPV